MILGDRIRLEYVSHDKKLLFFFISENSQKKKNALKKVASFKNSVKNKYWKKHCMAMLIG